MISIKQIKSDVTGPILFQGTSNIKRSLDLIWDDTLKEFQINGDVVFKNTWNASKLHIKAGATSNDITYILPITDPIAGQVLMASLPVSGVSTLNWSSAAGSGTANNGLTNTAGNVQLGGLLVQDTIIDGATNAWSMLFSNVKSFTANANSFNLNSQTFIDNYAVGDINDTGLNHLGTYTNSYTTVANDITIASTLLSVFSSDVIMLQTITSLELTSIGSVSMEAGIGGIALGTNTGGSISMASVADLFMSASGNANLSLNMHNASQTVTNNGTNNSMIVTDNVNFKGLVYAADYSTNFTPESLVSKRYVDSIIVGGGSMATADNGLTATAGNVQLGGALVINTDITGAFDLQLGTIASKLNNLLASVSGQISLDAPNTTVTGNFNASKVSGTVTTMVYEDGSQAAFNINDSITGETEIILAEQGNGVSLLVSDGTNTNLFVMMLTGLNVTNNGNNNSMVVYDAITSKGLVYAADYSVNFTDESIVSKRYVDTLVTAGAFTASNGLTKVVNDVQLGGALTSNTIIDGAFDLKFGTAGANNLTNFTTYVGAGGSALIHVGGATFGQFQTTDNNVAMLVQTATSGNSVYVDAISATMFSLAPGGSLVQISTYNTAQTISDGSTNNYLVIRDDTNKGIAYYADYSANFTNESLVTRRYVDTLVTASTFTASNGLTKVANDVQLGGLLTSNTIIDGAFDLKFGTAGGNNLTNFTTYVGAGGSALIHVGGSTFGQFQTNDNYVSMLVQTATSGNSIYVDTISSVMFSLAPGGSTVQIATYNTSQTISDGSTNNYSVVRDDTGKGIAYYADYSANFTNESLVTKRYVTAALATASAQSLSSVLTTGNTSGGLKILFTAGSGIDTTATAGTDTLNIGTTNADVINIGRTEATVNIFGTRTFVQTVDTEFIDALIRLNKNGAVSTGINTGFEIEENAVVTGYLKTNGTRNGWLFKAPASFQFQLDSTALTANRSYVLPNNGGTLALLSDITAITGTANRITVTAGVVDIAATYVGQSSITTLGTITTGTWNGTVIANTYITSTLSSKTLDNSNTLNILDTLFTLQDNTDTTKQLRFELSGISTSTTRVVTVPDADGTLVLRDGLYKSSVTTTDNTPTTVHTIPTSSGVGYLLEVRVIARKVSGTGIGTTGDTDGYVRNVKAKNVAGVVTLGTVQSTYTNEDITTHDVAVTVSGTNVLVSVTGTNSNNIIWQVVSEWIKI